MFKYYSLQIIKHTHMLEIKIFIQNSLHKKVLPLLMIFIFSSIQNLFSQTLFEQNAIKEIIITEQKFSIESQFKGLKEGFLSNMDTSALSVNQDGLYKMYGFWKKKPDNLQGLVWYPTDVIVSSDKLWAVTNGVAYSKSENDSVYKKKLNYFTVWKRENSNQPYKFIFDDGISYSGSESDSNIIHSILIKQSGTNDIKIIAQNKKTIEEAVKNYQTTGSHFPANALSFFHSQFSILLSNHSIIRNKKDLIFQKVIPRETSTTLNQVHKIFNKSGNMAMFYHKITLSENNENKKTGYIISIWSIIDSSPKIISMFISVN